VWGGDYFIFFRPIFNIADASITTGVLLIILFQKKFFREWKRKVEVPVAEIESPSFENDGATES
jgi:signal peptidase II